ncbi:MAG: hypothetical protein ACREKJ_03035 [Candidatus Rokuibacteriota bacterium]
MAAFFGGRRLVDLSGELITRYIAARQEAGVANGTISRELGVLGRLLRLAYEHGKLGRLPLIHKPKAAALREGFERAAYEAVRRNLPVDLQVAVTITYTFGWRTQSEILPLERRQVDLEAGTLRLDDRHRIVTPGGPSGRGATPDGHSRTGAVDARAVSV